MSWDESIKLSSFELAAIFPWNVEDKKVEATNYINPPQLAYGSNLNYATFFKKKKIVLILFSTWGQNSTTINGHPTLSFEKFQSPSPSLSLSLVACLLIET